MMEGSIRDLIDHRAVETPDAIFVIDPSSGTRVTYHQLREQCRAVCALLENEGLKPGASVAYAMTNGADAVRVILGTMYGGYLAVAINLVSGKNTISHVVSHSQAEIILYQPQTLDVLREAVAESQMPKHRAIDEHEFDTLEDGECGAHPKGADDGLLMYTSGTTGVPKGVVLTHSNLLAGGHNAMIAHQLSRTDSGLCVLPLYHINGLCVTIMGALVSGGSVIVPDRFSVTKFWDFLAENSGTWFSVVPTQISYLLHEVENSEPPKINGLRFGRSASAPLAPDVQQAFEAKFGIPIIETMGLTETAAQILSNPMDGQRKIGSPGIPFGNEVMIFDEDQKQCPPGVEGEVCVRGRNVMKCYRNDEAATAASITPEGWLRTGDLGRMDDDGYVFITGRLKELIIKGGENIAPREIDEALYGHPDVVEAAAFARACSNFGQRVEAGVMVREGSALTADDLINLCREKVGSFKAPDHIHFLPELPKGPSGKIQRRQLADMTAAP